MLEKLWAQDRAKLNQVELVKLEKDGLESAADVKGYGNKKFADLTPDDIERLKWLGLYLQNPKTAGYFMMRVKVPGGLINAEQLKVIAGIAKDYGQGIVDITTRQALQFHWLTVDALPEIIERLESVGLTTVGAAGDCPRNVMGHALAGIDADEVIDTRPLIQELNAFFQGNRDFSNLPRKFKISISGSRYNTGHAEINDIAFFPATKRIAGEEKVGFHIRVGGGLSRAPQLAEKINVFVKPEEVVKVAAGVATIFRDYGYREKRTHARLKFLVGDWGIEKFTTELLKITGPLCAKGEDLTLGWNGGYYYGINKQKQTGLNYIGLPILGGRCTADTIEKLAMLAETYGDGSLRTVTSQNFILANIPDENIEALRKEELLQSLHLLSKKYSAYTISCVGKEFCPFGLVTTKENIESITTYLDEHIPVDTPIRIHISGCVHSCGQPQIADIGLQGVVARVQGEVVESFELWIGGALGIEAAFGTKLEGSILVTDAGEALATIIQVYTQHKREKEIFTDVVKRVGSGVFQEKLDEYLLGKR